MKTKERFEIWDYIVLVWLLVFMAFPEPPVIIKYGSLLLVTAYAVIKDGTYIPRKYLIYLVTWLSVHVISLIVTQINGFQIDFKLIEIYLIRPIVLIVITRHFAKKVQFKTFINILIMVTVFIELYNVLFILQTLGFIPEIINEGNSLSIVDRSFLTMRVSNQTALCFLVPCITVLFKNKGLLNINNKLLTVAFYGGMIVSLISGRRILQFVVAFFLLVVYIPELKVKTTRNGVLKAMSIVTIVGIAIVVMIRFVEKQMQFDLIDSVMSTLVRAFDKNEPSTLVRTKQVSLLLSDWIKKPIFGWGLGAYNREYYVYKASVFGATTTDDLWSYEYFYFAYLYHTGLTGVLLAGTIIMKIIKNIRRYFKLSLDNEEKLFVKSILFGSISFMIAGATNPMITSIWYWFIVISVNGFVVCRMREERRAF